MTAPLRVGTRASALALWQTERIRALLHGAGVATERIEIRTTGDAILDTPLSLIGSRALFTKQLDDALLEGRIDLAVHSLKDLPTQMPEGIALAAVGLREDPRDALVGQGPLAWADLPAGATVGTSSLRRRAQLLRARPDLDVVDLRGNVDTRLGKLDGSASWSAILLAVAGLERLGLGARIGERLPMDVLLPAPSQGALGATARAGDDATARLLRGVMHDDAVELAVTAERAFLRRLEGGCQVPIGAYAELRDGRLRLRGRAIALDGSAMADGEATIAGPTVAGAEGLGVALAERLLREGAEEILAAVRRGLAPVPEAT